MHIYRVSFSENLMNLNYLLKFFLISIICIFLPLLYYHWTIPSNSIWQDQISAIENFKEVIQGEFPFAGYNMSIGIPTFPIFYYLLGPFHFLFKEPIEFYYLTAFINILSFVIIVYFVSLNFSFLYVFLISVAIASNIWGLFYGSFLWNQNFISFFMSLFLISLFHLIKSKNIIYFHLSGILINLIIQMSPQSIVLIPSFMIILFVLKLLPPFHHQLFHSFIHFILISPWLIHSFILFPEKGIPTHSSLFQDFSTSFVEYTNFIGGWGLMKENGKYLDYGTIVSSSNDFFFPILSFSTFILFILISISTFLSFKFINLKSQTILQKFFIALSILNLSSFFLSIFGLWVAPHHFKFLFPTVPLFVIFTLYFLQKFRKLFLIFLLFISISQASYSYTRAYSESVRPYITDIGYQEIFSNYVKDQCPNSARVRYVTPKGIHTYLQYGELEKEVSSCDWMLVQKNHYDLSIVIFDLLNEKFQLSQEKFKDYLIWIPK